MFSSELITEEIDEILESNKYTQKAYMGCFPSNGLPKCIKYPCSMVVNFDDSSKPGTHWVAIYAPNSLEASYFDSFGGGESKIGPIIEYLNKNFNLVKNRTKVVQSPLSTVCGYYAIFFIYLSNKGFSFKRIERILANERNPDK